MLSLVKSVNEIVIGVSCSLFFVMMLYFVKKNFCNLCAMSISMGVAAGINFESGWVINSGAEMLMSIMHPRINRYCSMKLAFTYSFVESPANFSRLPLATSPHIFPGIYFPRVTALICM